MRTSTERLNVALQGMPRSGEVPCRLACMTPETSHCKASRGPARSSSTKSGEMLGQKVTQHSCWEDWLRCGALLADTTDSNIHWACECAGCLVLGSEYWSLARLAVKSAAEQSLLRQHHIRQAYVLFSLHGSATVSDRAVSCALSASSRVHDCKWYVPLVPLCRSGSLY